MSTMLQKKLLISMVLAVAVGVAGVLFMAAPAKADNFYNVLYNTYCSKMGNYYEKCGCKYYLQGRIQYGHSRNDAASQCYTKGCDKLLPDPQQNSTCKASCDKMKELDAR